ncbi:hypothetical protein ACH4SP_27920 [Streptomyces sp. NPDC021093]|uniref:hypothetical protein n=1 Tax=Streptomyces sp. NPDC021093 TaxID=3365112 RepID=UPI0037AA3BE1
MVLGSWHAVADGGGEVFSPLVWPAFLKRRALDPLVPDGDITSEELRVRSYDVEPLFRWFHARRLRPALLLLFLPLEFLPLIVSTALTGNLNHPEIWQVAQADFLRMVRLGDGTSDFAVPLVRDYPSLINVVIAAVTLHLAFGNCRRADEFAARLHAQGMLRVPPQSRTVVRLAVLRANRRFAACGRHSWAVALLSAGVALLLMGAFRQGGVFSWLAPDGDTASRRAWSAAAYQSWWASPEAGGLAGPLAYGLVATTVSYVMIKHNLMGVCLMSFFVAIRKDVHYAFDMTDADGFHGWKDARALVQGVVVSVLISLVAFGSLFLSLSVHQVRWTTPLLLLFLLGVPTYFVGPLLLIRRAMRGFREREIARLRGCFADLRERTSADSLERFEIENVERREIAVVRDGRVRLFRVKEVVATTSVYLGSVAAAMVRILTR